MMESDLAVAEVCALGVLLLSIELYRMIIILCLYFEHSISFVHIKCNLMHCTFGYN